MKIPEGFTPRGDSNEQPLETYDKRVAVFMRNCWGRNEKVPFDLPANGAPWKIPNGPLRIHAFKVLS